MITKLAVTWSEEHAERCHVSRVQTYTFKEHKDAQFYQQAWLKSGQATDIQLTREREKK